MVGWFSRAWFLVFKLLLIYRCLSVAVEWYRNRDNRANRLSSVVTVDVLIRRDCLVAEANRLTDQRLSTATMNRPASVDVECPVLVKFSTRYIYIYYQRPSHAATNVAWIRIFCSPACVLVQARQTMTSDERKHALQRRHRRLAAPPWRFTKA